jgi:hypothetical protein
MKKLLFLLMAGSLLFPSLVSGLTPTEVLSQLGKRVGSLTCREGKKASVIKSLEGNWTIVLMAENGNIVMVEADENGDIITVYFGRVWLAGKELRLEVQHKLTEEEANVRFPHPCVFLVPWET